IPTTGAEAIEQYSIRLAEEWKIGRDGVDDGVILLVAKEDRKLRIEVGYGLEGAIPDAGANRIIDEFIVPEFKRGNFYDGIAAGVDALAILIRGEDLPPPEESADDALLVVGLVFGIMACAFGLIGLLLAFFTHRVWGIILTVVWVSTLLAPLSFLGIIGLDLEATLTLAVFCWIVFSFFIFVLGILVNLGRAVRKSGGSWSSGSSSYSGGSSSYSSSGSSSFSSSSSSSSSSFSGGGGSFGGGGASGSW
ncbi:MAG: TPM domain-containing protein, partial [Leptospiraceae bacterium]|nr:TPM domain-containing protein [Leptospiraceae bacterium]